MALGGDVWGRTVWQPQQAHDRQIATQKATAACLDCIVFILFLPMKDLPRPIYCPALYTKANLNAKK
jgi:hypothetical protein